MEGTDPVKVNKKLAAALAGGAVVVLALTGCSEEEDKFTVDDWAKKYCDAAKPQLGKQAAAEQLIRSTASDGKPGDIQTADSRAFQDLADVYKGYAGAFRAAGTPPVENGEQLVKAAAAELDVNAKAYLDLKQQVDELDTGDQQEFADGLVPVADGLAKIEQNQSARDRLRAGETGKAMTKQPGCKPVAPSSGSPS
ncbi:small secreted protein [Streptomyces yaizuensis]|uniref:Small secreted protein n=1 Tax=Streptomyces yaizuensis TaxID=2989713 RepID=A0ABQ5P0S2_9ACTN|nr:small secreted protein [Streptomyces sp. YSPA8]GLF96023.1 small secreted protein [Streptomyces sp. YSPA8]